MQRSSGTLIGLLATAAVASVAYVVVARRVADGATRVGDMRARQKIQRRTPTRAETLAEATGHIGKWYVHVPLALAGGATLIATDHRAAGVAIIGSSFAAAAVSRALEHLHEHRTPPPGKHAPSAQSFPSNHAVETTAVAVTVGWVLSREEVASPALLVPAAIAASLISGVGRLLLDKHWPTDSIAGYCAGIAVAATCAAGYEWQLGRR